MSYIKYKIIGINVTSFSAKNFDAQKDVEFNSSFQFLLNNKDNLLACISAFNYFQEGEEIMSFQQETIFEISPETLLSLTKDDKVEISKDILQYLATISVGTARGEIHARCQMAESNIQNVILPPINLTKIITTSSIFKI